MKKRRHVFDIIIIVFVVVMGALVVLNRDTIFKNFQPVTETRLDELPPQDDLEIKMTPTASPQVSNVRMKAPDFKLETLDGTSQALSDYLGKTVMINFWATWCPPCRVELPVFESFADRFSEDFVVLAINSGEERRDVQDFLNLHPYELTFLLDESNSVGSLFQVRGLPTSIFIDPEGFIQYTHIGQLDDLLLTLYLNDLGILE